MARSSFEQASIALEDVILLELDQKTGSVEPIIDHLYLSHDHLNNVVAALRGLVRQMNELEYKDLPELHTLNLLGIGVRLSEQGLVRLSSWQKMESIMRTETFYGNVKEFEAQLQSLMRFTRDLIVALRQAGDFARDGGLEAMLEENKPENFKPQFAILYAAWNRFMDDFLASSMISTEIWYAHTKVGSLQDCALVTA